MPSFIILLTERHAAPGKVKVRVLGWNGKPVDSLDKAARYDDREAAQLDAKRIRPDWLPTIIPVGYEGVPPLPWGASAPAPGSWVSTSDGSIACMQPGSPPAGPVPPLVADGRGRVGG